MLWKNIIASKSNRSGSKEAVIATDSYRSGTVLAVIASRSYCSDSWAKAIPCNAVTF
jgi:hypothetical protein